MLLAEKEFITVFKENNEAAISLLYDKYASALYGIILKEISDEQLAESILIDVFLCFFKDLPKSNIPEQSLFVRLYRILRNIICNKKIPENNYGENSISIAPQAINKQPDLSFIVAL